MAETELKTPRCGAWVVAAGALLGTAKAVFDYNSPSSGIDATFGALLVVLSSGILFIFGCGLLRARAPLLRAFLLTASFIDIAGTAFAAYLLESQTLLVLMLVCFAGWLMLVFAPRSGAEGRRM